MALLLWDLRKGSSFSAAMSPSPPTRHRDPHTLLARGAGDCGPGARRSKFKSHHSGHDLGPGSGLRLVSPCTLCTCWVLGTRKADSYLLTQVREAHRAQSPGSRVSPRGGLYVRHSPEPDQGGSRDQRSPRPLSVQHLPGDITRGAECQVQHPGGCWLERRALAGLPSQWRMQSFGKLVLSLCACLLHGDSMCLLHIGFCVCLIQPSCRRARLDSTPSAQLAAHSACSPVPSAPPLLPRDAYL